MLERFRIKKDSANARRLEDMAREAVQAARPRAYYRIAAIASREEDCIVLDGVVLKSRVLQVNTRELHRVFPFVATCGTEMAAWSDTFTDMLDRYFADEMKLMALRQAMRVLKDDIRRRFAPGRLGNMQPGSLEDWPIFQQKPLFQILGDTQDLVGVTLTDSMLMVPDKSESGIFFESEKGFNSCRLCPVENCPSRRERFDPDLYQQEYGRD